MSDTLYSIKESTLTDIGDALRRKHGETRIVEVEEFVPTVQIVKTKNATGFDTYEGTYYSTSTKIGEVSFTGATKIKVTVACDLGSNQTLMIASGSYQYPYLMPSDSIKLRQTEKTEFEFEGNVVTFGIDSANYVSIDKLGVYAECIGYDADGEVISTLKMHEAEVKNTYSSAEVAQAIDDIKQGADLPEEAFNTTGDCQYKFASNGWNWFLDAYGDRITTKDISNAANMFYNSNSLTQIPFEFSFKDGGCNVTRMFEGCSKLESIPSIDFKQTSYQGCQYLFNNCSGLKEVGTLKNMYPSEMGSLFNGCRNLRELPQFENLNLNRIYTYANASMTNMFQYCNSLRSIPEDFLKQLYQPLMTGYYYSILSNGFSSCYSLDEIRGLNPQTGAITSNMLSGTFSYCSRLKDIIFATQDDGSPYVVKWKSQTMDLSTNVGYTGTVSNTNSILNYNSGITKDKQVTDDATYQALKNDPDWFTQDIAYSRYNKDSAVNTINSLPDTSAYGTNTIKFKGAAGSATDGGAINTLTAEQIAVASARGWTVTFA